jgi:hypothetical protein
LRTEREQGGKKLSAAARKAPLPRHEGKAIKPQAAVFHASIQAARLDCHPQRINLKRQEG